MMSAWLVSVRNDSWNYSALDGRFRAYLLVEDLQDRVAQVLNNKVSQMRQYPSLDNGVSQPSEELGRLRAFQTRVAGLEGRPLHIDIGAAEVPVDFNRDLFAGRFVLLHCWRCQRLSTAEETWIDPFAETDGSQVFGRLRKCMCGNTIAYQIKGQRRP